MAARRRRRNEWRGIGVQYVRFEFKWPVCSAAIERANKKA